MSKIDEASFNAELGCLVRKHRRMLGMSQQDVAKKIGVTFQQVQKYESGESAMSVFRLREIARVLEMSFASCIDDTWPQKQNRIFKCGC
jgi:transcriptional regulator with XRE-family HTH domain